MTSTAPGPRSSTARQWTSSPRTTSRPRRRAGGTCSTKGKPAERIWVTGNTGIDALATTVREGYSHPELKWARGSRLILITAHRRENLGEPMHRMFRAIRRVMGSTPTSRRSTPYT